MKINITSTSTVKDTTCTLIQFALYSTGCFQFVTLSATCLSKRTALDQFRTYVGLKQSPILSTWNISAFLFLKLSWQ